MTKINELEQALSQEQQRVRLVPLKKKLIQNNEFFFFQKTELQRTVQDLQAELVKSRSIVKESLEKNQELEKRFHETDKNFEETIRIHLNETTEPTRRELSLLRAELVTKSDQITFLQNAIDEEKLKRYFYFYFIILN